MNPPPPIGIFAFGVPPTEQLAPQRVRALLAEAALQEVDLRFFAGDDCDLARGKMTASRWVRGGWTRGEIDLPGLVVVTTNPVTARHHEIDAWLRRRTRILGFRERNKLEVSALLARSPWSSHAIPSEPLDATGLEAQLSRWLAGGGIVVKPSDGMRGIGIHFVLPAGGDAEVVRGDERWRGSIREAASRVAKAIRGRMRYRTYLVERYIDSRDTLGQPVAIRVDVARLPEGGWGLIRMAGRIAAVGSMVSNGARGGAYMGIDHFLAARGIVDVEAKAAQALALATGVADVLTTQPGPTAFYECGVDLAIDPNHRLWFIEANPRPQAIGAEHERAVLVIAYLKALTGD